jgi:hypothetical protein
LKDPRYKAIKSLIVNKSLNGLTDVFTILPYSIVREDLKINYNTLKRRIDDGNLLKMEDIIALSKLIEVDPVEIFRLSLNDINRIPKTGNKKK